MHTMWLNHASLINSPCATETIPGFSPCRSINYVTTSSHFSRADRKPLWCIECHRSMLGRRPLQINRTKESFLPASYPRSRLLAEFRFECEELSARRLDRFSQRCVGDTKFTFGAVE